MNRLLDAISAFAKYSLLRRRGNASPLRDCDFGSESDLILKAIQSRKLVIRQQESGPRRFDLINAMIVARNYRTYLEIGVRDPRQCFDRVHVEGKWSVDPGLECETNQASFKCTSDEFFAGLGSGSWSALPAKWDLVFIDGLHRADQVWRDIGNSLRYVSEGGAIFLHDCLPPSDAFARERFVWQLETATCWSGTSWKALSRYMVEGQYASYVVDTDWGVGVIDTRSRRNGDVVREANDFYELDVFRAALLRSGRLIQPERFLRNFL